MKLITVACGALNQTPLDWDGNFDRIVVALNRARSEGVQVLCLPELAISGYGCEDLFLSPGVQRTALEMLRALLPHTKSLAVGLGLPLYVGAECYNAVALACDGVLHGFVLKQYLAREGLYYEPRWFRAWPRGVHTEISLPFGKFPVGDLYFEIKNKTGDTYSLGFEICEDAWAPTRPGARLAARGVQVILNPSASHFAFGRFDIRKRFVLEGSRAFGVSYLYANLLGNEAGRVIYDGSRLVASGGELVAQGERFQFTKTELTVCTVDLDLSRIVRPRSVAAPVDDSADAEVLPKKIEISAPWETARTPCPAPAPPAWEGSVNLRYEEFARAQALGLFDYLTKSNAHGFVVSLSGGADSATVACLVRIMTELLVQQCGIEEARLRLKGLEGIARATNPAQLTERLLHTVYQSTANSSAVTKNAAQQVAHAVGATHAEWNVQPLVEQYTTLVAQALSRTFEWKTDDVTLQNIQARVRAPGVWMLANAKGALLLPTSNRSEVAVGYATMDGDTAGGLAPLGGIDKDFIRRWLVWLEKEGPQGLHAIPALKAITDQPPTAELRPPETKQTDEQDLMPYEILNRIERAMIEQGQSPSEILLTLESEYCDSKHSGSKYNDPKHSGKFSQSQLVLWIERFMKLFSRNQWKRERYAPSFHMDGHNLDPRSWYRFPILSGGFAKELREIVETSKKKTSESAN